jgi:hypothetical protein
MNLDRSIRWVAVATFALVVFSAPSNLVAQPGAFGGGYGPPLAVVPPSKTFATSDEHYKFLLAAARGHQAHDHIRATLGWPVGDRRQYPHGSFIDPPGSLARFARAC